MKPPAWKLHGALLIVTIIYGSSYIVGKEVMPAYIKPTGFILLRLAGALSFLIIMHRAKFLEKIKSGKDYLILIACGFFGVGFNMTMFFRGLSLTSPIDASLIMVTNPIIVLVIAFLFKFEKITWLKVTGIVFGAAGAVMLVIGSAHSGQGSLPGNIMIVLNATSYSIYLFIVKGIMKKYHYITVMSWSFFFGFLFVLPFGAGELLQVNWAGIDFITWLAILFTIIFTTIITYLFNAWALQYVKASLVGSYVYFQPLVASFIALATGKYILTWQQIVFAVLIFTGVYLVSRENHKFPGKDGIPTGAEVGGFEDVMENTVPGMVE